MLWFFFQGNVTIVDTPGVGDNEQDTGALMMMDYLKNAVAVVFVLNVANAGGIQNDRVFFYYVICVTQSVGLLIWVGVRSRASTVIKQCQFAM